MSSTALISVHNISVKQQDRFLLKDISFSIEEGQQWAITGSSGSGKTTLAKVLLKSIFHSGTVDFARENMQVLMVEQQHRFRNQSNLTDFYYQQRYNSSDAEDSITVEEALQPHVKKSSVNWIERLHLTPLLQEPLIQLSNGENKRLQIAEALFDHPDILILDNPFTGLDTEGRATLTQAFDTIIAEGVLIILIISAHEIPASITHVAELMNGELVQVKERKDFIPTTPYTDVKLPQSFLDKQISQADDDFTWALQMKNVTIRYGDKIILDNINWEVKKGERWNVSGPNGAGKSTLLSLITADNPQAYANEMYLFDQRRGRGESIWHIKKKIGFLSPELHLYFDRQSTVLHAAASGLFDTIGLFRQLSEEDEERTIEWLKVFGMDQQPDRLFFMLSPGEQRRVLLARALIKNPPLLILDEPFQGLDREQVIHLKSLLDHLCFHSSITLICVSHYVEDLPGCISHHLRLENGRRI